MTRAKVFGIGLNKTGTISLHEALEVLGYRSLHWGGPAVRKLVEGNAEAGRPLLAGIDDHDAYSDILALSERFDVLDEQYPGSRFVLTTRPVEHWVESRRKHVQRNRERAARGEYAGDFLEIEPDAWRAEFAAHHERVAAYFEGRHDLLVLQIAAGDGWERLCPFLGAPVPDQPFPHRHRADPRRR
ncbi:MAG: sulfotransferase [Acidimicrobiales bacterium]|nr:sulfotransferase family protein [Actinomycetota bacterium]MCB1016768.1 hypothetical protein [Acidimicrobiales bacterium]